MTKRSKGSLHKRQGQGKSLNKKLLGSSLAEVRDQCSQLAERLNALDQQLKVIGGSLGVIWNNQKELTKSEELLDEQFAVLTRLSIISFNALLRRGNITLKYLSPVDSDAPSLTPESKKELVMPSIGYSDINVMFHAWAEFRQRPDFREHMQAWVMGNDLSELPPPPEVKKEGEANAAEGNPGNPADGSSPPERGSVAQDTKAAVPEV